MAGVAVFGITGRMGQALMQALREQSPEEGETLRLSGALGGPSSGRLGEEAALEGIPAGASITADPSRALDGADVALDFSVPQSAAVHAEACAAARVPLLVGTTGLEPSARHALAQAARRIPVLIAPNTSVGVTVLTHLLEQATAALGPLYDVDVSEAHHRTKRDAPSGTALALAEAIAAVRGAKLEDVALLGGHADMGPRKPGSIGFSVLRAGDIVGDHTVSFVAQGERLELTHRAGDRLIFARGALRAARWLIGRPAGLYDMRHVLGLR
jgi:4-hydroxy-tetrahydrodipicolinate reductase